MKKSDRHEAVAKRASAAIADLYHNATLPSHGWPDSDSRELKEFEEIRMPALFVLATRRGSRDLYGPFDSVEKANVFAAKLVAPYYRAKVGTRATLLGEGAL